MFPQNVYEKAARVVDLAANAGKVLGSAESCTGGLISAALTAVPGSSVAWAGGVCSYATRIKSEVLGVPAALIDDKGVVSEEVAASMAQGTCRVLGCDIAVSTTGIAGPGGAEPGKPVGTVCFGLAAGEGTAETHTAVFDGDRDSVRMQAVEYALDLLLTALA